MKDRKDSKHSNSEKGFTLVELMIAAAVLALALLSTAFSILNLSEISELSRERIVAMTDANRVLEAMHDTANTSLATMRSTDWTSWASTNVIDSKAANELKLNQESVTTVITTNNPSQVTLTLTWMHKNRQYTHQIITLMTDRM